MGAGKKICVWFLANCEVQLCSALAAISILGVVVVCPVLLDPAIDTLVTSYDKGWCQTVYSKHLTGLSNCTWTSCREGCTADIYSCYHIIVVYMKGDVTPEFESANAGSTVDPLYNPHIHTNNSLFPAPFTNSDKIILPMKEQVFKLDNLTYVRDLNATLVAMMNQIQTSVDFTSLKGALGRDVSVMMKNMGIGALIPNPQGCVYPFDTLCTEFEAKYGQVGLAPSIFECYISLSNRTFVMTTVDKAGAVRMIFYSLVPLIIASGVFTYLFYRVGLIGRRKRQRKSDEESGSSDESPHKNGVGVNGIERVPPVVKKKLRKKFLPRRDSSKKRRRGKIFNKKNLLSIKQNFANKSPSLSRRTPSISMAVDDGYGNHHMHGRNSTQLL